MKKRIRNIINMALAALIVALGFGSCRTSKHLTDNQRVTETDGNGQAPTDTIYLEPPAIVKPPEVDPPVCVYAPPPVMEQKPVIEQKPVRILKPVTERKPVRERPVALYGAPPTRMKK